MDDMISRAAVLDAIEALQHSPWYGDEKDTAYHHRYLTRKEAVEIVRDLAVKSAPAVDAVRVIRCKNCKYSDTFADTTTATTPLKCLNIRYGGVYPDWYCEHGERRDEDGPID